MIRAGPRSVDSATNGRPTPGSRRRPLIASNLERWLAFSRANAKLQQFGQAGDVSTFNGATGCTHTVLQRLIKAKTGVYYTHDQISKIATYPWPAQNGKRRGMYSGGSDDEVGRVMRHFGLPYYLKWNASWAEVQKYTRDRGPVLIGIRYGYWPEKVGYVYQGRKADGKPGGYAIRNGKTQLAGAELIYHATLFLGNSTDSAGGVRAYANEPNHGSASRPEKPDYDIVNNAYAQRAYEKYGANISGSGTRSLMAWLPTAPFSPKGY